MTKQEYSEKRRLLEDRQRLYQRIVRVGFVPDADMRDAINQIQDELGNRIIQLRDELMGCDVK